MIGVMRLKVKITASKKIVGYTNVWEAIYAPTITVNTIEIFLNDTDTKKIFVQVRKTTSYHKFKRTAPRIIHEVNKNLDTTTFHRETHEMWSSYYNEEELECFLYIDSSDLSNIRFSESQRREIKEALDRQIKTKYQTSHNPSKSPSQMELRKRAYYGKCKKW